MSSDAHVQTEVRDLLRSKGLRGTASRIAVLVALRKQAGPMSHEQLMATLGPNGHDKASVWRILSDLADAGILRRMDLGDRIWRYELRDTCRAVTEEHAHFLCESCGEVSCLPPLELRAAGGALPPQLLGAQFQVRVMGTCARCNAG